MYYVSYGSNLNKNHMARLVPHAKLIGKGILKGYELVFRYYADIKNNENSFVNVGVWEINAKDEKRIDYYESFPSLYRKEIVKVEMENGETKNCMVYIMNDNQYNDNQYEYEYIEPSMSYLKDILKGYNDFGIKDYDGIIKALLKAN